MTPKIALFFGITAASLALAAPAYGVFPTIDGGDSGYTRNDSSVGYRGDSWGADRLAQTTFVGSPDAIDRAIAAEQRRRASVLDARERAYDAKREVQMNGVVGPDVFERAVAARERLDRSVVADDRFRIDPVDSPVTVTVDGSGREVELPQLGIGFAIALMLGLGILLALRTRRHPLAH
jgi:hypothetical protein